MRDSECVCLRTAVVGMGEKRCRCVAREISLKPRPFASDWLVDGERDAAASLHAHWRSLRERVLRQDALPQWNVNLFFYQFVAFVGTGA